MTVNNDSQAHHDSKQKAHFISRVESRDTLQREFGEKKKDQLVDIDKNMYGEKKEQGRHPVVTKIAQKSGQKMVALYGKNIDEDR